MRFLVIGTGSVGQRHCRNLVSLGQEVLAWDMEPARLREAASTPGVTPAATLEQGFETRPEGALICTPPASHLELASRALEAGAHLFVEKPISHTSDDVDALLRDARRSQRCVMVGLNLRFLPSLKRVKELLDERRIGEVLSVRAEFGSYLPDWRPGRDYRDNYAVHAAQGGGILLDAIHEFDYLVWLLGDVAEVWCTAEHRSDLAGDTEDLVEATLRFESGVLAQVHLDYIQRVYRRRLQMIGEGGNIEWDYPTHSVSVGAPGAAPAREDWSTRENDSNAMYLAEIEHFIGCVQQRESPLVDGQEALRSLRVVEAAKRSARERRWEKP
jgi:predicted dehydrogenase